VKLTGPHTGALVVVEGPDGLGKTTLCRDLVQMLQSMGLSCIGTAEPSQSPIGQLAKARLKTRGFAPLVEAAIDAECFCGDMIHHNAAVIQPGVARGEIIICDRYDLSPLVYQFAQGLPQMYLLYKQRALVNLGLIQEPDLTLLLTGSVALSVQRLTARNHTADDFETANFLARVHDAYRAVPTLLAHRRIVQVSAEATPAQVLSSALGIVTKQLGLAGSDGR